MQRTHCLTSTKVRVDTHVPCSTAQTLALSIRNVLLGLGISVLLGHTEVNNMDHWIGFSEEKIAGNEVSKRR